MLPAAVVVPIIGAWQHFLRIFPAFYHFFLFKSLTHFIDGHGWVAREGIPGSGRLHLPCAYNAFYYDGRCWNGCGTGIAQRELKTPVPKGDKRKSARIEKSILADFAGVRDEIRTHTAFRPLPPQSSVSTNSTTRTICACLR